MITKDHPAFRKYSLLQFLLGRSLSAVSTLIPKNNRKILFFSEPDFSDNAKFLYYKMIDMGLDQSFDLIWAVRSEAKGKFIRRRPHSLPYIYHLLTAKYLISTNEIPYWKSSNQVTVLLWHGFPGKDENSNTKVGQFIRRTMLRRIDHLIVTSPLGGVLFRSKFHLSPHKISVLGEPRCDALFNNKQRAGAALERVLGESINGRRLILYLPTWREYDTRATPGLLKSLLDSEGYIRFLRDSRSLFLFKPHIYEETLFAEGKTENTRIITNHALQALDLTLYDFLGAVDVLVTDYSSVGRDYLLLNRPIVFYVPDLEEYRQKRGFLLEPYELWSPGDMADTPEKLIWAIQEAIKNPSKWEKERTWLRDLMFAHKDGESSRRIINSFWSAA